MADNEPMSDERLAEIHARVAGFVPWMPEVDHNWTEAACEELLTEVDRLRVENAAMRSSLEDVLASADVDTVDDAVLAKARALLGTPPQEG